jgi:ketosteroid isomerase-like protein
VEIARRLYASGVSVGQASFTAAFPEFFHPDAAIVPPADYPDAEPEYVGIDGFLGWQRALDEVFDDWRIEAEHFLDAGDRVVVLTRVYGTDKRSGTPVSAPSAHVLTLVGGRVARVEIMLDRAEALGAAGLED